jgi:hypothetical protein
MPNPNSDPPVVWTRNNEINLLNLKNPVNFSVKFAKFCVFYKTEIYPESREEGRRRPAWIFQIFSSSDRAPHTLRGFLSKTPENRTIEKKQGLL